MTDIFWIWLVGAIVAALLVVDSIRKDGYPSGSEWLSVAFIILLWPIAMAWVAIAIAMAAWDRRGY